MKRIVILGGGTGGTLTANRLRRSYDEQAAEIVVVDHDADHVYQPGLLFVPFGLTSMQRIVRPRRQQFRSGISFRQAGIDRADLEADRVHLDDGTALSYDVLVVATGARLLPEETHGLTGPGWLKSVFTFCTPEGAVALHRALERFTAGRLVVNVVDMPIKCPVAPLEFCFLADYYFRQRGIRDRVELTCVTPLDGAFTRHPATCSGAPKMTSLSRARAIPRWAGSMPSRPEAGSSSPDRAACPHRGVGGVTAAKPGSQYPRGYAWNHYRSVRSTHVQPSCLRPLQEDHLDGLRPACGAGPRRGPAREPLHLSARTSLNGGQAASA